MKKLVFIIPTGIGASIGGYAGDAGAYVRKLSEKYTLIVNPNVVNAACFSAINDNMLYAEGFALDLFFKEKIAIREFKNNKIGVIFDRNIPEKMLNIHINTLNAIKYVYGIKTEYVITTLPVGVEFQKTQTGISTGNIKNVSTLIDATKKIISMGCNAIAPVCLFGDDSEDEKYANGQGVDIVGGVEAVISHLITKEFLIPCAHAPAFSSYDIATRVISPKSAAEYITPTFLPCVILGLYNAPHLIPTSKAEKNDIKLSDISGLVVPYNSLGCVPVFKCIEKNIPIYAIKENVTEICVDKNVINCKNIIELEKYDDLLDLN